MALELTMKFPNSILVLFGAIFVTSCAYVGTVERVGSSDAVVEVEFVHQNPSVLIHRVRSWFTVSYPWEKEVGAPYPLRLFLSPGKYTFQVSCELADWAYADWVPEVPVELESGGKYVLGCRPMDQSENFFFRRGEF